MMKIYILVTLVSKNSRKMFLYKFPQALEINTCPRTIICNTCELLNVSGDILNYNGNVEDRDDYSKNPLLL